MKEKDPWKTLLQGKLADHRETPPPDLWPRLEQRLGPAGRPAPRLRAAARLRLAGSVLSAAAALTALFILLRYPAAVPPEQAPAVMSHIRNSAARQPDAPHRQHAKELTASMPPRAIATARPEKQPMTPADHHGPAAPALAALADSRPDSAVCPTPPPGDRPTPGPAAKRAPHLRPTPAYRRQPDARTAYADRSAPRRWQVGAYAGAQNLGADRQLSPGMTLMSTQLPSGTDGSTTSLKQPPRTSQSTRARHQFPIHAGLSVRYRLNSRWALESGAFYSYLASTLTSGSGNLQYDVRQKLQYVGIPLNVSYTLAEKSRWSLYATAGGSMEVCVGGRTYTRYLAAGTPLSGERQHVRVKRPQWSVGAALGGQFELGGGTALYAEPGVTYYFDNHSTLATYYQDHPLNFSLRFGLRFSLP